MYTVYNMLNIKALNLKSSLVFATIYIMIMAVGMYVMHHVFGFNYQDPRMTYVILWIEVILVAYAHLVIKKVSSLKEIGFGKIN